MVWAATLVLLGGAHPIVAQQVSEAAVPDTSASVRDSLAHARYFRVLPVAFTGPATGPAVGVSTLWLRSARDTLTRPSQVEAVLYVTSKRQLDFLPVIEFWSPNNVNRLYITGEMSYYPTPFFGTGTTSPQFVEEDYTLALFTTTLRLQHRIAPHLYVGVGAGARATGILDRDSTLETQKDTIPGMTGGVSVWAEQSLLLDTRDNIINPGHGGSMWIRLQEAPKVFGTFTYLDALIDLRKYFTLGHAGILAFQGSYEGVRGTPAFDLLPNFGGPNDLRGYVNNRFKARNVAVAQAEWRQTIVGRLGYVAFVGAGAAFNTASDFGTNQIRTSYGLGLRYMIVPSQRANIRVDFGLGQNSNAIYAGFGEAF